jgi:hypothetical protein
MRKRSIGRITRLCPGGSCYYPGRSLPKQGSLALLEVRYRQMTAAGKLCESTLGPLIIVTVVALCATWGNASAQTTDQPQATSKSLSIEQENLQTSQKHHYDSPADRAQDAMLITEVKSALAQDGVAEGHAVAVDCDHGRVRLTGAVDSAADARHAEQVASSVQGVTGVDNRLIWR